MKVAELKKLNGDALLKAASEFLKELNELNKNSVTKDKYKEALSEIGKLTKAKEALENELSTLKETSVLKVDFDKKVQLVDDLIQDKKDLEHQYEKALDSIEPISQKTTFLVSGILGTATVDLICRSISEKFIGESDITVFGDDSTPLTEALVDALKDETIPEQFVLVTSPCVAINPFSMVDLKFLRCKKNGDFNTGLPFVLEREKLAKLEDFETIEELMNAYHAVHFGGQVPMLLLDVGPDNLKCGVYRANPRMDLIENALISKKFFCFNDKGLMALEPIIDELYPTVEEEE